MKIKQGQEFHYNGSKYRRESDAVSPLFESERIQVTHLSHPDFSHAQWQQYTFGTEPAWFIQRQHQAA